MLDHDVVEGREFSWFRVQHFAVRPGVQLRIVRLHRSRHRGDQRSVGAELFLAGAGSGRSG